jgi:hypothetical protein
MGDAANNEGSFNCSSGVAMSRGKDGQGGRAAKKGESKVKRESQWVE